MENIKKNQMELKNTITEIKNTLEGINRRLDDTEERSVNWRLSSEKSPKLNKKEKKNF